MSDAPKFEPITGYYGLVTDDGRTIVGRDPALAVVVEPYTTEAKVPFTLFRAVPPAPVAE